MWIRETRQFRSLGGTAVISAELEVEAFKTKEQAIPKGAKVSETFGEPVYEKGDLHFIVWESK